VADQTAIGLAQLTVRSRVANSSPPDHGAAIARDILADPALSAAWRRDVNATRQYVASLRAELAQALGAIEQRRFRALATQKGMFSLLPISPGDVDLLAKRHGICLVSDGRINLAGLRRCDIPWLAAALREIRHLSS
jgi:aromatic-amino-acid transaminase